ELSQGRGELWERCFLLNVMSQVIWQRGDKQRAETLAREGISCAHALEDWTNLAILLETLAWMAAERAAHDRAVVLLGSAQRTREGSALPLAQPTRPLHERTVALATERLGQAAFDVAFERGRMLTISEGADFAVTDKQPPRPAPAAKSQPQAGLTSRQLE